MMTRRSRYLISVDELRRRLDEPSMRVIDVRWSLADACAGRADFASGHVPGAIYLSWLEDLSDPDDAVEGQLAPVDHFASIMSANGIGNEHEIVAYDDGNIFMAARLMWILQEYGHDRVRVLDGGWPAWIRSGAPVHRGAAAAAPRASFTTAGKSQGLRLTKEEVLDALRSSSALIVDCRMDETYRAAGAHIPGALRLPAPQLFDLETGRLLDDEQLLHLAAKAGIDEERPVILYCGGGISASAAFMALRVIGIENARVYDGSWSEWGADDSLPKEHHGEP